jgi:hypothetical protein
LIFAQLLPFYRIPLHLQLEDAGGGGGGRDNTVQVIKETKNCA